MDLNSLRYTNPGIQLKVQHHSHSAANAWPLNAFTLAYYYCGTEGIVSACSFVMAVVSKRNTDKIHLQYEHALAPSIRNTAELLYSSLKASCVGGFFIQGQSIFVGTLYLLS